MAIDQTVTLAVTAVGVVGNGVNVVAVLVSVLTDVRVWPPGERDWRYWLTWGCWYPATAALVVVGVVDWGSLDAVPTAARVAGGVTVLVGLGVAVAAIRGLGVTESTGVSGELQTDGLYRYSRNPQYFGDVVATVGWAAVTDSRLVVVVGATAVVYYGLLPFAEEPWLRTQYGAAFESYCRRVPRFVSPTTIRRIIGDLT